MKIFTLIVVVMGVTLLAGCRAHLKDDLLRERFSADRKWYEKACLMVAESGLTGYLAPDRQRALLAFSVEGKLSDDLSICRAQGGAVQFTYSARGLAIGGSSKGIAYVPEKELRSYRIIAIGEEWPSSEGYYLKKLDGDWYIFLVIN